MINSEDTFATQAASRDDEKRKWTDDENADHEAYDNVGFDDETSIQSDQAMFSHEARELIDSDTFLMNRWVSLQQKVSATCRWLGV